MLKADIRDLIKSKKCPRTMAPPWISLVPIPHKKTEVEESIVVRLRALATKPELAGSQLMTLAFLRLLLNRTQRSGRKLLKFSHISKCVWRKMSSTPLRNKHAQVQFNWFSCTWSAVKSRKVKSRAFLPVAHLIGQAGVLAMKRTRSQKKMTSLTKKKSETS